MQIQIEVPTSLSEVTLEQYQRFTKINTEENQESNFLMHKTVEIFCNLDLKDVAKIRYNSVKDVMKDISSIFVDKQKLIPTFHLDGVEYGFIPVLDDMSLGEYVDLDENISDWSKMHKAMAVLFRPVTVHIGSKYQIEDYKGLDDAERMKRMPLDVVMGAMVFFYLLRKELLKTTLSYLGEKVQEEMTSQQQARLAKSMDGTKAFTTLVEETLGKLMLLPDSMSMSA